MLHCLKNENMEGVLCGLSYSAIVLQIEVYSVSWARTIGVGLSILRQSYYQKILEGYEEKRIDYQYLKKITRILTTY